ncbi:MAG TPA: SpoIIE family protein phosphatase, partial [Armatimonadota bacterium]|nr:SpoIIE family protein phosphatase [Armatimonadota bacterium]
TRLDRSELITILEQKTKSLLNADTCSLMIRVPDKSELQILGPGHQLARQVSIPEHIDLCEIEAARVATTGESCFIENVPNCEYCRYRDLNCSDNGTHHMLSVPMIFQNRLIGAVNAFRINKPPFNKSDERKLSIIASAAAGAIENAEAYRRESETADKLQRGIKPGSGFKIPNFLVGCDYIPCVTGTIVGGDFYDVINLDDNNVAVVIADVAGKGIDAAIQAATARFTIRGLLLAGLSPAKTLEKLNRTLYELLPDEVFITLFCGILNTATGEMTYANAGHDFPVVFCHDLRSCTICELTGYALGMVPDANYTEHRIKLKPDDIAVLYTDGITEARHEGRFFGIEGLQETITRNSVMYPNDLVRTIFEEVFSFSSGDLRDDAGLLIIKALPSLSD